MPVTIGIDPHRASHTAAALSERHQADRASRAGRTVRSPSWEREVQGRDR